jgi:predicted CXXCH cytochrome family protein
VEDPVHPNLYPQPVFHEMSIGCERCHGPGKAHIDYQRSNKSLAKDPIVNPVKLGNIERDAVCYQCHFNGEVRFTRHGRKDTDFRPGEKLSDNWLVFVKGTKTEGDSTEAVSQAMQMQSSQCYIKSDGRMGCISCHDPHSKPPASELDAFYKKKCLECHADRGCSLGLTERLAESANDSCIQCHMAPLKTRGVPHTSQSDHRVLRRALKESTSTEQPQLVIYAERGVTLPQDELNRARGLMIAQSAQISSDRGLAQQALAPLKQSLLSIPEDKEVLAALGTVNDLLGHTFEAQSNWQRILQKDPTNEMALLGMANSAHDRQRFLEASGFYTKLLDVHAWKATVRIRYANVLGQLGKSDQALQQARISLQIDPTMVQVYDWLSQCYEQLGDKEQAEKYQNLGHRLRLKLYP